MNNLNESELINVEPSENLQNLITENNYEMRDYERKS